MKAIALVTGLLLLAAASAGAQSTGWVWDSAGYHIAEGPDAVLIACVSRSTQSVRIRTEPDTATAGEDYQAGPHRTTFRPDRGHDGEWCVDIGIPWGREAEDSLEQFYIIIDAATIPDGIPEHVLGTQRARVVIEDSPAIGVSIAADTSEVEAGGSVVFTLTQDRDRVRGNPVVSPECRHVHEGGNRPVVMLRPEWLGPQGDLGESWPQGCTRQYIVRAEQSTTLRMHVVEDFEGAEQTFAIGGPATVRVIVDGANPPPPTNPDPNPTPQPPPPAPDPEPDPELPAAEAPAVVIGGPTSATEGETIELLARTAGGVFDTLSYAWSGDGVAGDGDSATLTAPGVTTGTDHVVAVAVTAAGEGDKVAAGTSATAEASWTVTVLPAAEPEPEPELEPLTATLTIPSDANLVEGRSYRIGARLNRAVAAAEGSAVLTFRRDRSLSDASNDDFEIEPIRIRAGQDRGSTSLRIVEDNVADVGDGSGERLILYVELNGEDVNDMIFTLWDHAVPTLPGAALLLLALLLAGAARRHAGRR